MNKKLCKDCGIEKSTDKFYLRVQDVCKSCFEDEVRNSVSFEKVLRKYNVPFIESLLNKVKDGTPNTIGKYMKAIHSPQYLHLTWKDSELDEKLEMDFFEGMVKHLRAEAKKLSGQLTLATNRNDTQLYISTVKSLRDTLDLISKYDWRLQYSESCVTDGKHQISIWEQNHDSQIRNHKVWNISEAMNIVMNSTKETGNAIGRALQDVSEKIKATKIMYVDYIRNEHGINKVVVYVGKNLFTLQFSTNTIVSYTDAIRSIATQEGVTLIYLDTQGYGIAMYDELSRFTDIVVEALEFKTIN